jgi:CHAT domain-containing protein
MVIAASCSAREQAVAGKEAVEDKKEEEIAQRPLDADCVILSTCKTAADSGKGNDGLSGLAHAFFRAGARALLVSHWSRNDQSALEIMTNMFGRLQADGRLTRSQAPRHAILSQIQHAKGDRRWEAYPGHSFGLTSFCVLPDGRLATVSQEPITLW